MASAAERGALERHRIPAVDRTIRLLGMLEQRTGGATIRDLAGALRLPRTSVYRIVNTLELHQVVQRTDTGAYALGPRLIAFAARVPGDRLSYNLIALAQPVLEQLSDTTGEATKLSIVEGDRALVVAAVSGKREYALAASAGQRVPLHAGAAGKVLLANLGLDARKRLLARPLEQYTRQTLSDRRRLVAELARVRRQRWAQDRGEFLPSVHAFAVAVRDRDGRVVAALSLPFLAGADSARAEQLRVAVIEAAAGLSGSIARADPVRRPGDT